MNLENKEAASESAAEALFGAVLIACDPFIGFNNKAQGRLIERLESALKLIKEKGLSYSEEQGKYVEEIGRAVDGFIVWTM